MKSQRKCAESVFVDQRRRESGYAAGHRSFACELSEDESKIAVFVEENDISSAHQIDKAFGLLIDTR